MARDMHLWDLYIPKFHRIEFYVPIPDLCTDESKIWRVVGTYGRFISAKLRLHQYTETKNNKIKFKNKNQLLSNLPIYYCLACNPAGSNCNTENKALTENLL